MTIVASEVKPLEVRPKLGEEATKLIRTALLRGRYAPGERLRVDELARQLGSSTMPVREALLALSIEGLVDVLPRRGFRARPVRRLDFEDVFRVHAFVAGELASRAADDITLATLDLMTSTQQEIDRLASRPTRTRHLAIELEERNFLFHRLLNKSSDSGRLQWFLRATTRFIPRQYYETIPGWIERTVRDHPPIIAALREGDGIRARELMVEHVTRAGEDVIAYWDRIEYPELPPLHSRSRRSEASKRQG